MRGTESELQHLLQREDRTRFLEVVSVLIIVSVLVKLAATDYGTAILHARFGQIYSYVSEQRISHVTYYAQHGEWPDDEKRAVSAGAGGTKAGDAANESGMSQIEKIRQWQSLGTFRSVSIEQVESGQADPGDGNDENKPLSAGSGSARFQSVDKAGRRLGSADIGLGDAESGEADGNNTRFLIVGSVNFKMGSEFGHGRGIPVLGFRPATPGQEDARVMRFVCGNDAVPASAEVSGPNLTNLRQVDLTYVCRGKR